MDAYYIVSIQCPSKNALNSSERNEDISQVIYFQEKDMMSLILQVC